MTEASGGPRADDGARCDPEGVVVDGGKMLRPGQTVTIEGGAA